MKSFALFLFFAGFYCSEVELKKFGDEKEIVIPGRFLERATENYEATYDENISANENVAKETVQNKLGEIFSKQGLLQIILCNLKYTEQLTVSKTCKFLQNTMLHLYKQSMRDYPRLPEIYSYDKILCLSATDARFQKNFVKEIMQGPAIFKTIYDDVKAKVQKIPNVDEYCPRWGWDYRDKEKKIVGTFNDLPEHEEYNQLAEKGWKIMHSAVTQVNEYNLSRQKMKALVKSQLDGPEKILTSFVSLFFTLYVVFLISLPFNWGASAFLIHLLLSMLSFSHHLFRFTCCFCCEGVKRSYHQRIFAQIPKNILRAIHLFGIIAGPFNIYTAFLERSQDTSGEATHQTTFLYCTLSAVFIGCSDYLPILAVLARAWCRECVVSREPIEIRKAKKTIQNIKRSFFVEN